MKRERLNTADFNSHAHVERDSIIPFMGFSPINFNSHAHVERDLSAITCRKDNKYFNSHAHVERDPLTLEFIWVHCISTHTLTWSVTLEIIKIEDYGIISTHTLTWSVT